MSLSEGIAVRSGGSHGPPTRHAISMIGPRAAGLLQTPETDLECQSELLDRALRWGGAQPAVRCCLGDRLP
jgi:hypothetical protein